MLALIIAVCITAIHVLGANTEDVFDAAGSAVNVGS
jgi:hypothetical protein